MFVKCIKGFPGILEEEQIYEVEKITIGGHFLLVGVQIPSPYTCFHKDRFIPLDIDEINIEDVFELVVEI